MRSRRIEPEAMDAPDIDPAVHRAALRGLARLNRFSGVSWLVYRRLRKIARRMPRPLRVLDVATGSGDLPIDWLRRARRDALAMHVTGVDISPQAIQAAAAGAAAAGVEAQWLAADVLENRLPAGFDVVTCSLFMHHLRNGQVVRLLRVMRSAADDGGTLAAAAQAEAEASNGRSITDASPTPSPCPLPEGARGTVIDRPLPKRLLVCDLARSRMNLVLVSAAARLLSRSPVVHGDAALSVRAAMTRREFADLAERALGKPVRVIPAFPCRFIAEIDLR